MIDWVQHFRREAVLEHLARRAKLDDPRAAARRLNDLGYHKLIPAQAARLGLLAMKHIHDHEQAET